MRKVALVIFVSTAAMLSACHRQQNFAYTSTDANEDAALNALESQSNGPNGMNMSAEGLLPAENAQASEANVQ